MRSRNPFLGLLVLAILLSGTAQGQIRHVKSGATGTGASWSDATGDLQGAIDFFVGSPGQIWVAAGTYKPGSTGFRVSGPMTFYGGFPADATDAVSLLDRDPRTHRTILSGDLAGDDEVDPVTGLPIAETMTDNACRVLEVQGVSTGDVVVVDGFVIEGGNAANVYGRYGNRGGGGIWVTGSGGYRSYGLFRLQECEVRRNRAGSDYYGGDGGGMYAQSVDVYVENCRFLHNAAGQGPDGSENYGGQRGYPGMSGGDGGNGGGVAVQYGNNVSFQNVLFKGNVAGRGGNGGAGEDGADGGMGGRGGSGGKGGGLFASYVSGYFTIDECTFHANQAGRGGDGGRGGDSPVNLGTGGQGGDGGGYNPNNYQFSGGGGGVAYDYCSSYNVAVRDSSFAENQSGAGGAGGAGGQATGAGGQNGEPGQAGVGGAGGGVLSRDTRVELRNCTLVANQAAGKGGALALFADYYGSLDGCHLTLADNVAGQQGGAVVMDCNYGQPDDTVRMVNSIFTGNRSFWSGTRSASDDVWAEYPGMTVANSLIGASVPGTVVRNNCLEGDPLLKPLAHNGGPTPTMAPAAGSPAIGASIVDLDWVTPTDQRGFYRDATPDLGAFESLPQARCLTVADITKTSAVLAWTAGYFNCSAVFLRPEGNGEPRPNPEPGTIYEPGDMIASTPWLFVYAGEDTTVDLTGLTPGTAYRVMVCDWTGGIYNTEDAADNPLVFSTAPALDAPVLISPVHCPDEGAEGPEGDDPAFGHSRVEAPIFVWEPPADAAEAHFQVWLDGEAFEIGNTAIDPIGFRCFDGESWTDFPATGMPAGTLRLAFRRAEGGETIGVRAGADQAREWWVVVHAESGTATSLRSRFLVRAPAWEDGDAVAGYTLIRKAQLDQLRAEANALRRLHGMGDFPFADDPLVANATPVRAVHFQELREAIAEVVGEIGQNVVAWAWTDPVLNANQTAIRAVHVQELRDALEGRFPETVGER